MRAVILLVIACVVIAPAQEWVTAQMSVSKPEVFAGEPFYVRIYARSGRSTPSVEFPQVPGLRVEELPSSPAGNGIGFVYRLTATTVGTYTIPSVLVRAGESFGRTNPLQIRVQPAVEPAGFRLVVEPPKRSPYTGEVFDIRLLLYSSVPVGRMHLRAPFLSDRRFRVFQLGVERSGKDIANVFTYQGRRAAGERTRATFEGITGEVVTIPVRLQALLSGSYAFEDVNASVDMTFVPARQSAIDVRALPEPRPQAFGGLVGKYTLSAEASPAEVVTNQPVLLRLKLQGPMAGEVDPRFIVPPDALGPGFRIDPDPLSVQTESAEAKRFAFAVRPMAAGIIEVPPVSFAAFDPETGSYETVRTQPVPLRVKGRPGVIAEPAASEQLIPDRPISPDWTEDPPARAPWLLLAFPPFVYAAVQFWRHLRARREAERLRRLPYEELRSAIRRAESSTNAREYHSELLRAIRVYGRHRGASLDDIQRSCEAWAYGRGGGERVEASAVLAAADAVERR